MASAFDDDPPAAPYSPATAPPPRSRRRWTGPLLLALVAFVAGIGMAGWAIRHWTTAQRYVVVQPTPVPVRVPRPVTAPPAAGALPAAGDPRLARQVDAIGARLDQVDARARAAVGNADRAEGLLVTFAARRAIERGIELGYLEGMLREHFGAGEPQAVATIISAARQPVTMAELRTGLAEAEPALTAGGAAPSNWAAFKRELSNLIVLRRSDTESTAPVDRYARARTALEAGQVDAALAEVARMPGRAGAAPWIAKARRYLAARNALDRLETAALMQPDRPMPIAPAPAP